MENLYVAFKKTENAKGIFICKVLGIDQRSQSWIIDKYIIFIRSDEDYINLVIILLSQQ